MSPFFNFLYLPRTCYIPVFWQVLQKNKLYGILGVKCALEIRWDCELSQGRSRKYFSWSAISVIERNTLNHLFKTSALCKVMHGTLVWNSMITDACLRRKKSNKFSFSSLFKLKCHSDPFNNNSNTFYFCLGMVTFYQWKIRLEVIRGRISSSARANAELLISQALNEVTRYFWMNLECK